MKKIYEDIKKVFESEVSFKVLCGIGVIIVALLIFSAGVTVGFRKASFGRAWGEHYNENFGMGRSVISPNSMMGYFPNAHGATGKIVKIELPNIIVKDNTEKTILISNDTTIAKGRDGIGAADLKVDDFIIAIGTPDDKGVIEAKFIRVIPSPEFLNN
jgi:hypothetical protein